MVVSEVPKTYRADTPAALFAKSFLGHGKTWSMAENGDGSFTVAVHFHSSEMLHGYSCSREELADLWEMIGEALHHD
jgi:hypothetical protein